MSQETKPDLSCAPYRRKGLYFVLTVPLLSILVLVFVYLWSYSFLLSLGLLFLYLATCTFQAYCCAYQDCPYVGGFCPAIAGIMPANRIAKLLYGKKGVVKSKRAFEIYAVLAMLCWIGMVVFPAFWIARLGTAYAIGYVLAHFVYYVIFGLTICPVCAIRHTCPGGKLQSVVLKK